MIEILTWVSIFSGGILILMLLLSLIGGLDFDVDFDMGSTDVDTGAGGLGVFKGILTFVSVTAWVIKVLVATKKHMALAICIGILSGIAALLLLNYLIRLMLKNDTNVNWSMEDALYQKGEVYLKIPGKKESGLVHININGANRELKALSFDKKQIQTGTAIEVMDVDGDLVIVRPITK